MKIKSLLLVAALLIGLLAGCGTTAETAESADTETESTEETVQSEAAGEESEAVESEEADSEEAESEEPAASEEASEEPAAEETDSAEAEAAGEETDLTITMPLTEDEVTFTMWHDFVPLLADYMPNGMADNLAYATMEEISGVHMDITSVSKDSASTAVSLLATSGDYPNIWDGFAGYYGQGVDTAIEDGIIYDLAEYKDLMPNYFSIVDGNEAYAKETYTDSGAMGLAYCLNKTQVVESGLVIRQDWLDELGLDTPVTYDDFTEVLTAIHEAYGACYWTTYLGDDCTKSISAGFGVTAFNNGSETYFEQIDGEVVFSPLTDGYLEYLTLMNEWYESGILYPDFISGTSTTTCEPADMANGTISMVSCPAGFLEQFYALAEDENFELTAVARPVKNAGDEIHQGSTVSMTSTNGFSIGTSISDDDENFEILLKWLDYWYTDEGSDLANYGILDETYTVDADGNVTFTDLMTNNPDGLGFSLCMNRYVLFVGSFVNDNTRTSYNYTEKQAECVDVWSANSGDGAYVYPTSISLTTDETDAFSSVYGDISTYVESQTLGFITGSVSLDEFDTFRETIESMGVDELISIYQDALDRYNAR